MVRRRKEPQVRRDAGNPPQHLGEPPRGARPGHGPLRAPPRSAALAFARRAVLPWVLPLTREPYFGGILGGAIAQSATTLAPWLSPVVQKALHEGGLMGFLFSLVVCVAELTARDLERKYSPRGKD